VLPVTPEPRASALWIREPGEEGRLRTMATPLFIVLICVELTDLLFAVDSIPAVFAVTDQPMVAYTSNIFAILGLRSLYFLLAIVVSKLRFLKLGLSAVLVFIGAKMLLKDVLHVTPVVSLGVVGALLTFATVASVIVLGREPSEEPTAVPVPRDPSDEE
jgi:tellurite resistance protein TerC